MARRRRKPSVVFLTPAQIAAREQREARERRRQQQRDARARAQALGFGPQPAAIPGMRQPSQAPLQPRVTKQGIVIDPRGRVIGTELPLRPTKRRKKVTAKDVGRGDQLPKRADRPGPIDAADTRTPERSAGSGAAAVRGTIPPQAQTAATRPPAESRETPSGRAKKEAVVKQKVQSGRPQTRAVASTSPAAATPSTAAAGRLTDQQFINQWTSALMQPELAALQAQEQRTLADQEHQRQVFQHFTTALMNELREIPAGVTADYTQAANQTAALARESAAGLAAANPNAETQALLQSIGAPSEQQAQITAANQAAYQGGGAVLFGTEGALPGRDLFGSGATQASYARMLPAIGASQAQENLRSLGYTQSQERQQLADLRAGIEAKRPGYILQAQETLRTRRAEEAAAAQAERDFQLKQQAAALNAYIAERSFQAGRDDEMFDRKATAARIGQAAVNARTSAANAAARLAETRLQNDRNYQATLRRLGISDSNLKLRVLQTQAKMERDAKQGGFTRYQRNRLANQASDLADEFYNGVQDADGNILQSPLAEQPNGYQVAMSDLLSRDIPLVIAQRALNRWWRTPGKFGRPRVPYQLRPKNRR